MDAPNLFYILFIVQAFYSISITLLVGNIPMVQEQQLVVFTNENAVLDLTTVQGAMLTGVSDQQSLPFYEFGALVFFSSLTVLNILINFITAVPQMLSILLEVVFILVPINFVLKETIKGLFIVFVTIMYYYLLILFISGTRTQTFGGGVA